MQGAHEYATLFSTSQHGRLYLVSGSHGRGKTFRIFVLPEGEAAIPNGSINAPLNRNAVEVYGIVGGQPGWTESYGWLHEGKWQDDFYDLVERRRADDEAARARNVARTQASEDAVKAEKLALLATYV